jgi:glycosyltransferase involved in cell wall biosynthesis
MIHTLPSTSQEASGPTYSVVRLCEALHGIGSEVCLVTLESDVPVERGFQTTFPYGFGPRRLGNSPAMRKWLQDEARSGKISLIHNHSLWMMPNVYPGNIASRFGIPYVVAPRGCFTEYAMSIGSPLKRLFWPLIQKPSLRSVDLFHATAETELEDIRRMGFNQPVAIIPNGVDIPFATERMKPIDQRILLFFSRIHPNKGLDMLLPAWKSIQDRHSDWSLWIVGPDEDGYLETVKELSNVLGLRRVEFRGPVYGDSKTTLMGSVDLFVLPSYSENFGMVVAESLASGTPAIVMKGAPWDGLETTGSGWWIDMQVDALVDCLHSALSLPRDVLKDMGSKGREWMMRDFSWDKIARQWIMTYDWVCNGSEKPEWVRD